MTSIEGIEGICWNLAEEDGCSCCKSCLMQERSRLLVWAVRGRFTDDGILLEDVEEVCVLGVELVKGVHRDEEWYLLEAGK